MLAISKRKPFRPALYDQLLPRIGAHELVVAGHSNRIQILSELSHLLHVDLGCDVGPAVTDVDAGLGAVPMYHIEHSFV
jgi:hypothetical protein